MQFWNELEGRVFDGLYPLRRLMRSEGRTAWFETEDGGGQRVILSLTESLTDVDEVIKRLEAAQRLRDPNLLAIAKVGRARFERTLFVYAVMEYTEQNLSEVLRDQSLSKDEVQQVADALVGALTAIHQHGLLHGRVEPASVLAVGETIKLRSDCLQSPGSTRAGDVAGIGETLFEAFTRHKADKVDNGQINRLPAPFAEIVRNSLSSRWSLGQVAAALRPSAAVTVPSPASQPPPSAAAGAATPAKPAAAAQELLPAAQPPSPPTSASPPSFRKAEESEDEDEAISKSHRLIAIYIALAVAFLLIAGWLVFRHKTNPTAANAALPTQAGSPPAAAAPPQKPDAPPTAIQPAPAQTAGVRRAKPSAVRSAQSTAAAAAAASTNGPVNRPVWRVIAFTYNQQEQAQRKAEEISHDHADLQPSVFSVLTGGHPRFLVTIGGTMDRSHALALRDKAAAMGLPADTYVQNFSQ